MSELRIVETQQVVRITELGDTPQIIEQTTRVQVADMVSGLQGPQGPPGPAGDPGGLTDVDVVSPVNGDVLVHNGTVWRNGGEDIFMPTSWVDPNDLVVLFENALS